MPKTLFFNVFYTFFCLPVSPDFARTVETLGFLEVDQSKNAVLVSWKLRRAAGEESVGEESVGEKAAGETSMGEKSEGG